MTAHRYARPGAARFALAYPQGEAELSADDLAFAAELRRRAAAWDAACPEAWVDTWEDDDDRTGVLAGLNLATPGQGVFGASYVRGALHCGPLHPGISHFFCPWSPGLEYDENGSPEALAHRAADWFETLLRRPVVLWLWSMPRPGHAPTYYAGRFEFADTGDVLAERYDHDRAPAAQVARIREAGEFVDRPRGHVLTTETLTRPDAFRFISGDREAAVIADAVREVSVDVWVLTGAGDWLGCDLRWDTRRARELGLRRRCVRALDG
jgi:hypothetical protein